MCDMKDIGNNSFLETNLLGIKANYFAGGTTVSDHLIERNEFNLDGLLNRDPKIR